MNPNDTNIKIAFIDEVGDKWEEFNVFHHKFLTWLEVNGYNVEEVKQYNDEKLQELVAKSPYYKATSNDVDWMSKVRMQGEVQKWVDHSISVTINLPRCYGRTGWPVVCYCLEKRLQGSYGLSRRFTVRCSAEQQGQGKRR